MRQGPGTVASTIAHRWSVWHWMGVRTAIFIPLNTASETGSCVGAFGRFFSRTPSDPHAQTPDPFDTPVAHGGTTDGKNSHAKQYGATMRCDPGNHCAVCCHGAVWGSAEQPASQLIGQPQPKTNRQRIGHQCHRQRCRNMGSPPRAMNGGHHQLRHRKCKSPKNSHSDPTGNRLLLQSPQVRRAQPVGKGL